MDLRWDLGGFGVFYTGRYANLYEVEEDIGILKGSSNFSGLSDEGWFLVNKVSGHLEFMLLSVPSSISVDGECSAAFASGLPEISFDEFVGSECSIFQSDQRACFSRTENRLLVCSRSMKVSFKIALTDYFHLFLDGHRAYAGYCLDDATNHIASDMPVPESDRFMGCLLRMLSFCNKDASDAMDDKTGSYLRRLEDLERDCLSLEKSDRRMMYILIFIENAKLTFYDIEK